MLLRVVIVMVFVVFSLHFLSTDSRAAVDDLHESGFIIHSVTKGESISLLCIEYYGYYSVNLGNACKQANPEIKNLDLILVGQQLRFNEPIDKQATAKTQTKSAPAKISSSTATKSPKAPATATVDVTNSSDTLFIKKVNAVQGVVTCVAGTVKIYKNGSGSGERLALNSIIYPGDVIFTASDGRVELIINRETVIRMREKTKMTIETFRDNLGDKGKTRIGFTAGAIWTKVKKFKDRISRFELEMPNAIAGVHGTVYQSVINPDSTSEVKVYDGEVAVQGGITDSGDRAAAGERLSEVSGPDEVEGPHEVDMKTWTRIVQSMQRITIGKNGKLSEPALFKKNAVSDWEKWNEERDRRITEIFTEEKE